ncbi:cadherin domain-containing protein [Microvirga sp. 2MCAF35]|uniref:cadherin domain-containing protein n=1 Tax=Microvirga sp. 2MCAF35 TaxID=3232987 RepID=UPI003F9C53F2
MANYEISTPTTVVGTWKTLAAEDTVLVTAAGSLDADIGITSTVSGNRVQVIGSVSGTNYGIQLGTNGTIDNSGTITGGNCAVQLGVDNSSGGNLLVNSGTVGAPDSRVGVQIRGSATILNFNTIQGWDAINVLGGSVLNITNYGLIKSTFSAFAIKNNGGNAGATIINNFGTIENKIRLGEVKDIYDGRLGRALDLIDLGGGDNIGYGGVFSDTFKSFLGNDFIDAGDGIDSLLFDTASSNLTIDLSQNTPQATGYGTDTFLNFENVIAGGGADRLTGNSLANVLDGGSGRDTLDGGWGDDLLKGGNLNHGDSLFGGHGNDTLDGGFGDDTLSGGDGFDTVVFNYVEDESLGVYVNMANLSDPMNNADNATISGYGADTYISIEALIGTKFADHFIGDGAKTVFTGGAGNDTIDGGGGSDVAKFTGTRSQYSISAPDANGYVTVTYLPGGGDGADKIRNVRVLQFSDQAVALVNAAPVNVALSKTFLPETAPVHSVVATLSSVDADGDAVSYALANDAGGAFRIEGNSLVLNRALDYDTGPHQYTISVEARDQFGEKTSKSFTLDLTNVVETNPLVLIGTAGADTLTGESGNDRLTGNAGKDMLTGGAGQDIFVFNRLAKTNTAHKRADLDTITDFNRVDDTIHLAKSVFKGIAKKGVLAKAAFYVGTKAHDADDRIIYDKKKGALWYDADGTGSKAAIQIATLDKNLKLTNLDFFVV